MNRLPHKLREQADFEEAESTFGSGSYTRELMREAADALDNATKDVAFYMRLAGAFQCEADTRGTWPPKDWIFRTLIEVVPSTPSPPAR